jgi:uncharacterized protein (DUF934 family)
MQIIKDRQTTDNTWTFVDDDNPIEAGDIIVSLSRWLSDKTELAKLPSKIGIRLSPSDPIELLSTDIDKLSLIELNFLSFGDGRPFSQARLLRNHLDYQGEIRAIGQFLPDQVFYLARVGVNAFAIADADKTKLALALMNDFSVNYQASTN